MGISTASGLCCSLHGLSASLLFLELGASPHCLLACGARGMGWGGVRAQGHVPGQALGSLSPLPLTWAGPSLGWLRSAPSVITCRPIWPAAPVPVKGLGGWPLHLAIWSSSSLRGLGPVTLLPKLEARRNGCHRANSPIKGGVSPTGAGLHVSWMFSTIKLF